MQMVAQVEYVTVAVRFSSVTPLSVSTMEIYPSRRAMERAVFPFCHTQTQKSVYERSHMYHIVNVGIINIK